MNPAYVSLAALVVAIIVSCFSRLNVGVLALAFAWMIGLLAGIPLATVVQGFPTSLFLTLAGVTLLFTQAQCNGSLDKLAHRAMRICRGNAGLIPMMFFVLAAALASAGPGHIATTALVAPMAMAVAARAQVPAFLMAIMVGHGATSGSMSPVAPTGIIVSGIMTRIGLPGYEWPLYLNNLFAHAFVAFAGYFAFGGWRLFRLSYVGRAEDEGAAADKLAAKHWFTLAVIATLLTGVLFFRVDVGMGAFAGAVLLALARAADHEDAIRRMPWAVILMVCGVTVLIAMLEKTQGLDLFTDLLARFATPGTVTGMMGSFSLIGGDLGAPGAITGGIAEALIATAFGLGIAILSLLPFNFLNTKLDEAGHDIDAASTQLKLLVESQPLTGARKSFVPRQELVGAGKG